jgi:hypothetical protein
MLLERLKKNNSYRYIIIKLNSLTSLQFRFAPGMGLSLKGRRIMCLANSLDSNPSFVFFARTPKGFSG